MEPRKKLDRSYSGQTSRRQPFHPTELTGPPEVLLEYQGGLPCGSGSSCFHFSF